MLPENRARRQCHGSSPAGRRGGRVTGGITISMILFRSKPRIRNKASKACQIPEIMLSSVIIHGLSELKPRIRINTWLMLVTTRPASLHLSKAPKGSTSNRLPPAAKAASAYTIARHTIQHCSTLLSSQRAGASAAEVDEVQEGGVEHLQGQVPQEPALLSPGVVRRWCLPVILHRVVDSQVP